MIIVCNNCNKVFDIDANLIPQKGRLLQCNSCNHKWFFKKDILPKEIVDTKKTKKEPSKTIEKPKNDDLEIFEKKNIKINKTAIIEEKVDKIVPQHNKDKYRYNPLNLSIVFVISFIALIILVDTFKNPISVFFPSIEYLLYNLYESLKDINLFINDLI